MPFFNRADEPPTEGRSLMAYYAKIFDLAFSDFANPGSQWVTLDRHLSSRGQHGRRIDAADVDMEE